MDAREHAEIVLGWKKEIELEKRHEALLFEIKYVASLLVKHAACRDAAGVRERIDELRECQQDMIEMGE